MNFETLVISWMEFLTIQKGQRPRGVAQYEKIVRQFFAWLDEKDRCTSIESVSRSVIEEWLKDLFYEKGNVSNQSRASKLSALRSFFGWLKYDGHIDRDPTKKIPSPKVTPSLPQKFSTEELRLLFAAPDISTPRGVRDLAILKTLYAAGLRVTELVNLDINHIVDTGGYIRLQIIDGKGGKSRTVTMRTNPSRVLRAWLSIRSGLEGATDSAVFVRLQGKRRHRLSDDSIQDVLKKYSRIVGIADAKVFVHKMRSTFATDLYDSGDDHCPRCGHKVNNVNVFEISAVMGHEDPKTTMGYVAISERTLRKTALPDKRFNEIEGGD